MVTQRKTPPPRSGSRSGGRAALQVVTPKPKTTADTYPFELGGTTYHARMPKDFVWMHMAAARKAGASGEQKADAMVLFLDACLTPAEREDIRNRMLTPAEEDPVSGVELLKAIDNLAEVWKPLIEAEFDRAMARLDQV
jgi:hypothetical protein